MRMSEEEFRAYIHSRAKAGLLQTIPAYPKRPKARTKYGNKPTVVCGEQFDSGKEAARYEQLLLLERAGKITQLRHHVSFPIDVNDVPICIYEADFTYIDEGGVRHVEDVKVPVTMTPIYKLKRRLMLALHGITIEEIL